MILEILMAVERLRSKPQLDSYAEKDLHRPILNIMLEATEPLSPKSIAEQLREGVAAGRFPDINDSVTVRRFKRGSRFWLDSGIFEKDQGLYLMQDSIRQACTDGLAADKIAKEGAERLYEQARLEYNLRVNTETAAPVTS